MTVTNKCLGRTEGQVCTWFCVFNAPKRMCVFSPNV